MPAANNWMASNDKPRFGDLKTVDGVDYRVVNHRSIKGGKHASPIALRAEYASHSTEMEEEQNQLSGQLHASSQASQEERGQTHRERQR